MSHNSSENPDFALTDHSLKYLVIAEYRASNPEPISVDVGEILYVSERVDTWSNNPAWIYVWCTDLRGKSGWVAQNAITFSADHKTGTARYSYSASELTVKVGDELAAHRIESGWLWCTDQRGESGWIPLEHVTSLPA